MCARNEALLSTVLAGVVLLCGCADLALESGRVPTEMTLSPAGVLLTVGEPTKLQFVVTDQNGEEMPVPSWVAPPVWEVSDSIVAEISRDGTLTGMRGGRVAVTARLANLEARAHFRMNPKEIILTAPVIYLNQVTQNRSGTVSLIAGRPALLRAFVVADQTNWLESPAVRVTLLQDDDMVFERLLPPLGHIPDSVNESSLGWSLNAEVPGSAIRPGVRMVVELDPEGVVPLAPGSRLRYPAEGSMELDVVEPPVYRLILVPTISRPAPDSSVFDWTDGVNPGSEQMRMSRTILPVAEMEVEVRDTYYTNLDLRNPAVWILWLNEIGILYYHEGKRGYYYGVVGEPAFGVRGIANIAYPVSVGTGGDYVYTHEVGHTMNLWHAPCNGALSPPDYEFPYDDGSIGVWGYDIAEGWLLDPGPYRDVMGYCYDDIWISDFHFKRAMDHRLHRDGGINHHPQPAAARGPGRGDVLVVWGGVWDGRLMLEPAFVLDGPVALPETDGPYRIEGLGPGGEARFSLSFTPTPLADGGGSFLFFIPYESEWADNLDRIVLTGPEGEYTVTRGSEPRMAVVTDRSTGRIRAIIRDWDGEPLPGEATADVTITRGIPAGGLR